MKRMYIIAAVLLSLGVVSCQKEVIRPECGTPSQEVLTYRAGSTFDQGSSNGDADDETSEGDITDPNSDKDESARRKR